MRARTHAVLLFVIPGILTSLSGIGCAQNTEAPLNQGADQDTSMPTTSAQDAATQGSQVNVWVINAPGRGALPDPLPVTLGNGELSMLINRVKTADGAAIEGTDAGYAQAGINIHINTGSTTPTLTGTTTATASAAQTPSANQTVSPVQDIKPEISAAVPIAVAAPGGMVDQQAVATGKGQTSDTAKQSENELRWSRLEAMAGRLEQLLPILERVFDVPAEPGDVPTTQPAGP